MKSDIRTINQPLEKVAKNNTCPSNSIGSFLNLLS